MCSTRNVELVRSIGAAHVIDYTTEDFTDGGLLYDVILDNEQPPNLTGAGRLHPDGDPRAQRWRLTRPRVPGLGPAFLGRSRVNRVARQRLTPVPSKEKREGLLTLTGLIEAGKLMSVLDRRTRWPTRPRD